jgi:predicted nucleotide-binding protein (sugar kinase/HSP70/actin superfamily)
MFGCGPVLKRAAAEYAAINEERDMPTVLMVGEIYVRCDPFCNDFLIEKLEQRGLRVRLAPMSEWLEYTSQLNLRRNGWSAASWLSYRLQCHIQDVCYQIMARALRWPRRTSIHEILNAASDYIRSDLWGEAALTLGAPTHAWLAGEIDGAVSVGPLECMHSKLAESQFFHVTEREGLAVLCLPMNGDSIAPANLDSFAYEVHEKFRRRGARPTPRAVWRGPFERPVD